MVCWQERLKRLNCTTRVPAALHHLLRLKLALGQHLATKLIVIRGILLPGQGHHGVEAVPHRRIGVIVRDASPQFRALSNNHNGRVKRFNQNTQLSNEPSQLPPSLCKIKKLSQNY